MGINYSSIFPILVYSLPKGSIIYRLQTSSHNKHFIATIGGSLKSSNQTMPNNVNLGGLTHLSVDLRERMNGFRIPETNTLPYLVTTMKEDASAVKHNKFWVPDLDEVNVEDIVSRAEDKKEGENVEIETVKHDSSYGEYGENIRLPSSNIKELEVLWFPSEVRSKMSWQLSRS